MKHLKHAVFDILGALLIILSPTLGWLPGPGGIPLFLAGLGLLAVHHDWAKRLLAYVKENGLKLSEFIFREHPMLQALYDIVTLSLFAGGFYLLYTHTQNLTLTLSIVLIFTGLAVFIGNRNRLQRFTTWLKLKFKR